MRQSSTKAEASEMTSTQEREYYTVFEAAEVLDVSRTTIWRWIEEGRLAAYRVGARTIRIRKRDLEALMQPARLKRKEVAVAMETGVRLANEQDIWAGYDPERVRKAIRKSARALAGIDYEALIRDIYAARAQDSQGRPA